MTSPKLLFRPIDKLTVAVIGGAALWVGTFLAFDDTTAGQVWLAKWWPPLIAAGGFLNVLYGLRPNWELRQWAGTVLAIALAGRGCSLIMGVVDGTAASIPRSLGLCGLWILTGFLVAVIHLVYLPLPGVPRAPRPG